VREDMAVIENPSRAQLEGILEAIPVEISFVDESDVVKFWNKHETRIFKRPISLIGEAIQDCRSKRSVDKVNQMLSDFKGGKMSAVGSCTNHGGKEVYVGYFAVRDRAGRYLVTLEATQDITEIKRIEGERRLLEY
jgi:hypothetical protein